MEIAIDDLSSPSGMAIGAIALLALFGARHLKRNLGIAKGSFAGVTENNRHNCTILKEIAVGVGGTLTVWACNFARFWWIRKKAASTSELFGTFEHQIKVSIRSKWWPLPSHPPLPVRKSKFSFPKVAMVKMLYCNVDSEQNSETIWLKPWNVPLSERIANPGEWYSIIEKLG